MDREALRQRLMSTFLDELDGHVEALNRDLLALEKDPTRHREPLTSLFRTAHSLKGAARAVSAQPIEAACHELEGLLDGARREARALDARAIQLVFTAADALKDAGTRLRSSQPLHGSPLDALLPQLQQAARGSRQVKARETVRRAPRPSAEPSAPREADALVRVPSGKLDRLLVGGGELLVARRRAAAAQQMVAQLRDEMRQCRAEWLLLERPLRKALAADGRLLPRRAVTALTRTHERLTAIDRLADVLTSRLAAETGALDRTAMTLEAEIREIRLFPFADACGGLERAVRDLALASGKQVDLSVRGGEIEIDRVILEQLRDPLLHLIRNAVDHGVETPAVRQAQGKPPRATISVAAALRGVTVEITIADDGGGLDVAAIRHAAQQRQMPVPDSDRDAVQLVFAAGFSTAPSITHLSGRGVGLDVVKHQVESLHGAVTIASEPGRGTTVTMSVPLTLTTIRSVLTRAGGHVYAVPVTNVRRLLRVGLSDLASTGGREALLSKSAPVPVAALTEILGGRDGLVEPAARKIPLVVVGVGEAQLALAVDEFIAEEEILVKRLGPPLRRVRHFTGATILASGQVALILNVPEIVQTALTRVTRPLAGRLRDSTAAAGRRRVLVVDDSATTRSLERSILEGAGYNVIVAADGRDAWRVLQDGGADLVVADVEMPHMNGFELCRTIRGSKRFRDLPVILITALESDADRARGLEAGADAYLPKSSFDQRQLLETLVRLL